jgi:ribosome recycling factor
MTSSITTDLQAHMNKAIEVLSKEFGGLRTGRASPNLLEPIVVDAYGSAMHISQLGTVSIPEPRLLAIHVWDKQLVKAIEKAIRESGLGLNPATDGDMVRVSLPELTEERRVELAKIARKYAESARVAVRTVRREGMDSLKAQEKQGEISEDEHRRLSEKVQTLTDDYIKKIDALLATKEKDIMQV